MAYRNRVALDHVVRDGVITCDDARPTDIAVYIATGSDVGGVRLEMPPAETGSPARRGMQGMEAAAMNSAAMKTTSMKAATTVEAAPAAMETASTAVETATAATMETAASAMATAASTTSGRLRHVCEHEPCNGAREDRGKRQRDLHAASNSQHIFLHLIRRRSEGRQMPEEL
jgi:hypothetical protein